MIARLPVLAVLWNSNTFSAFDIGRAAHSLYKIAWVVEPDDPAVVVFRRLLARFGPVVDVRHRAAAAVATELADLGVAGVATFTEQLLP